MARPIRPIRSARERKKGVQPTAGAPLQDAPAPNAWTLYILECRDGTFYTGIAKDPGRRLLQHNAGRASRYTRSRRPVKIIYQEPCENRSAASIREAAVKSLSRAEKEKLVGKKDAGRSRPVIHKIRMKPKTLRKG